MKHIKTFESFTVNEEILGFSMAEKEKAFMDEAKRNYNAWTRNPRFGKFRPNTPEENEEMLAAARADKFRGKPSCNKGEDGLMYMTYSPESEVSKKFSYSVGGHTFGSGE